MFDQLCFFSFTSKNYCWSDPSPGSCVSFLLRLVLAYIFRLSKVICSGVLCGSVCTVILEFICHAMTRISNHVNILCVISLRTCCVVFTSIFNLRLGSLPSWNCNCAVMHSRLIKLNTNLLVIAAAKCKITRILFYKVKALLHRVYRGVPPLFGKADISWSAVDISICLLLSEWQICIF